jgi:carbon-monoxide dehydrogenase medium subunit
MKLRLATPKYIVDINRIKGLSYVRRNNTRIMIGALTRYRDLEASHLLQKACPMLVETAMTIGDPQIRNMGTIGGNISHGDPANNLPPTMIALDAEFVIKRPPKTRTVKAESFFKDIFTTDLKHNEILTEVRFPIPPSGSGGTFLKLERKAGDLAVVSVAAQLTLDGERCKRASIGLGSAGATPIKARKAEESLIGCEITDESIRKAAEEASKESQPLPDLRGTVEYKTEMVKIFTQRALRIAYERALKSGRTHK